MVCSAVVVVVVVSSLAAVVVVVVVSAAELVSATEEEASAADEDSAFEDEESFLLLDAVSVPQPASIRAAKISIASVFLIYNPPVSSVCFYVSFLLKVPGPVIVFSHIAVKSCVHLEVGVADIDLAVLFYLAPGMYA